MVDEYRFTINKILSYDSNTEQFNINWKPTMLNFNKSLDLQIYTLWKNSVIRKVNLGANKWMIHWHNTTISINDFDYPNYAIKYLDNMNIKHDFKKQKDKQKLQRKIDTNF